MNQYFSEHLAIVVTSMTFIISENMLCSMYLSVKYKHINALTSLSSSSHEVNEPFLIKLEMQEIIFSLNQEY